MLLICSRCGKLYEEKETGVLCLDSLCSECADDEQLKEREHVEWMYEKLADALERDMLTLDVIEKKCREEDLREGNGLEYEGGKFYIDEEEDLVWVLDDWGICFP